MFHNMLIKIISYEGKKMLLYMEVFDFDLGPQMDVYSIIARCMYNVPTRKDD